MKKGILSIDIADSALRYVYAEKRNKEYCVLKAGKAAVGVDLSVEGNLAQAINNLIVEKQIYVDSVYLTISRSDSIVHQVTLPALSHKEMQEVVSSEIERLPSFQKGKFEFIYKRYPAAKGKNKVVFAAVNRQFLKGSLKEIDDLKLLLRNVEVSPLNLKEIAPLIQTADNYATSCDAIFYLDEKEAYFSIIEDGKYKLVYKLSSGIQQYVLAASQEAKERVIAAWVAELKRVLRSYGLEKGNKEVGRMALIWDQEQIPDLGHIMRNAVADIDVIVPFLNKITNIAVEGEHNVNPIYVLALMPIIARANRLKLDFPSDHFIKLFQVKKYLVKVSVVALAVAGSALLVFGTHSYNLSQKITSLKKETKILRSTIKARKKEEGMLLAKRKEYEATKEQVLAQATYVKQLNRVSWAQVFSIVSAELPQDIALTSFKFSESGRASIKGQAFTMEPIAELIRRIDDSTILQKGKFDFLREKEVEDKKLYNFGIFAKLREAEKKDDTIEN